MHRRLSSRSLPTSAHPPMPQGHCTATQIRHWAVTLGQPCPKRAIVGWRDDCSRASPNPDSHDIRNRNLYMHCVLAVYTKYPSEAIARRLNHVLGLQLCHDVVEYAQRKMKWNGMLERVREKGPKHPWVMQTIDRLSFVEPQTENSLRSASKPRAEESVHVPNKVDNRSTEASPTRARTPRQTRNQRRLHARYRAAHSSNFTTRRWARKPLYTWLWLFQQRSRVKYHPITGDWEWENPLRRDIWWYKSAYEKPPSPASSQEPTPVVASLNEGVGSNPLPPSRMELNMDVISNSPLPEAVRVAALSEAVAQDLALTDMNIEVAGPETSRRVAMSEAVADGLVDINMESEGPGPESLALTDGPVEGEGDAMGGVEGDMEMGGGGGREKSSDVGLDAMELIGGMNGSWVGDSPGR